MTTGMTGTTATPTTGDEASTDTASTGAASSDATTTGTTGEVPTSGPGVLPGEDGMDAFCRRYVECGGTYYRGEQACLDATYDYWGECPSRKAALDAFGACMSDLDCGEWSPDSYNPNDTPCANEWDEVGASEACG